MKGPRRLPDFSVVVWIKKNENFPTLRSEMLAAAKAEPYEMTEYQGMADFHWGMASIADARKLIEALKVISQRPETPPRSSIARMGQIIFCADRRFGTNFFTTTQRALGEVGDGMKG
jgi:hypothetical protein